MCWQSSGRNCACAFPAAHALGLQLDLPSAMPQLEAVACWLKVQKHTVCYYCHWCHMNDCALGACTSAAACMTLRLLTLLGRHVLQLFFVYVKTLIVYVKQLQHMSSKACTSNISLSHDQHDCFVTSMIALWPHDCSRPIIDVIHAWTHIFAGHETFMPVMTHQYWVSFELSGAI